MNTIDVMWTQLKRKKATTTTTAMWSRLNAPFLMNWTELNCFSFFFHYYYVLLADPFETLNAITFRKDQLLSHLNDNNQYLLLFNWNKWNLSRRRRKRDRETEIARVNKKPGKIRLMIDTHFEVNASVCALVYLFILFFVRFTLLLLLFEAAVESD